MVSRDPQNKENIEAIKKMKEDDLRKNFYYKLGWFFSLDTNIKGGLLALEKSMNELKTVIENADKSSTQLSKAIRNLTIWGAIIATMTLLFEVIKYFCPM